MVTTGKDDDAEEEKDDRHLAIAWHLRLLIRQKLDREPGMKLAWIMDRAGISRPNAQNIMAGKAVGFKVAFALAEYFEFPSPGALIDEALTRWERVGRVEWAHFHEEKARRARERSAKADKSGRSGEHPSVNMKAAPKKSSST